MSETSKAGFFERFAPALLVLTVALAFVVGVLWQKVSSLESDGGKTGGTNNVAAPVENRLSLDRLVAYAKELKLNDNDFKSCVESGKFKNEVQADISEGGEFNVNGTPAIFINGRKFSGAFPFEVFKEVIDKELAGKGSTNPKDYSEALQVYASKGDFEPEPVNIAIGNSPVLGSSNANVIIIEYSDFECPYCARFYSDALQTIKKEYVDTGKAKFVYKQFPLISLHPNAQRAAEASLCANDQGKFWEWHDKVFNIMGGS